MANQEEAARKVAKQHGLTVARVFTDNDVSASTHSRKARPQFDAMLDAAERGEFETIIAYSMSRLTRRPLEWERLIHLGQRRGVDFLYGVSPQYDLNTADGRATARTVAAWDAAEAERTSERRHLGNAAKLAKGVPLGRPRVFGYEIDGTTPREDEAALLRAAYADVLAGVPVRRIARDWNAAGWRTTRGNEWSAVTTRNTLARERNAGLLVSNGERMPQSQITPIVTVDTWEAACAILATPGRKRSGRTSGDRWLSGVARCACGEPLRVGASWSRGTYSPAYVCQLIAQASRTPGVKTPPGHARIKAELLEDAAVPEVRAAMGAGLSAQPTTSPELARLVSEQAEVQQQLVRAKDLYATFGGSDDLARAKRLQADADRLAEAVEVARSSAVEPLSESASKLYRLLAEWRENVATDWGAVFPAAEALTAWEQAWADLGTEDRRAVARRHLAVTVHRPGSPERITFATR